ncbi:mitochondrial import inner membrane translocase subunit Tim21 [Nerophis lumbriciformis]|uniref:mitochondrial import inner membrane translocase subunit Tim21 n=1 Tax=Nerophis lumbriciformis TaxID=546530 RepID=UPI002AE088F5|nr:mitochondrial import inner membrane translocase subunit Tim21-like [Nerophis lumbriciformis]
MAYTQILNMLHRTLGPKATQTFSLAASRTHRTQSVLSTFCSRVDAPFGRFRAYSCFLQPRRTIHVDSSVRNKSEEREVGQKSVSKYPRSTTTATARKVKEAGRDFTYLIVVLIGLGVTGGLLFVVFQELFSSSSPNKVYGKAFDKVRLHPEVIGAFGEPIKCYGEITRRGRRQHISHSEFLKEGIKHMRLKFYIEGSEPGLKGTVHSESKENPETGKYEFRYIFVDIDTYPRRNIIVEDNR